MKTVPKRWVLIIKKNMPGFGLMGTFSYNGNKIITTGGGGMIVTNDEALAKKAKHLTTQPKSDPFEYVHDAIGYITTGGERGRRDGWRRWNYFARVHQAKHEVMDFIKANSVAWAISGSGSEQRCGPELLAAHHHDRKAKGPY